MFDIKDMFNLVSANGFTYDYTDKQFTIVVNQEVAFDDNATITLMYHAFVIRLKDGRLVYECSYEDHPDGITDCEYHVYTEFEINQIDWFLEDFYKHLQETLDE